MRKYRGLLFAIVRSVSDSALNKGQGVIDSYLELNFPHGLAFYKYIVQYFICTWCNISTFLYSPYTCFLFIWSPNIGTIFLQFFVATVWPIFGLEGQPNV